MKTYNIFKAYIIAAALLFTSRGIIHAGTFSIDADDTNVITTTNGRTSNNASAGYGNTITSSTSSFAIGGTNSVVGSINSMTAGNNNIVAVSHYGPSMDAYAFGGRNSITGASNVFVSGVGNIVGRHEDYPNSNHVYVYGEDNQVHAESHAYVFGSKNFIANSSNVVVVGIGNTSAAAKGNGYVFGQNNTVNGGFNVLIGFSSTVTNALADNSYVLGDSINVANSNGVILGSRSADGAKVSVGSITIGTSGAIAVAGASPIGVVSVGAAGKERQIINVAAGRIAANSTDAVNGSELYVTNMALAAISATVATLSGGSAADALLWNSSSNAFVASHGGANSKITGVFSGAVGGNSLDAINGGQLYGTASSIVNILGTGTVNADGVIGGGTFATGGTTVNQALTNLYNIYNSSTAFAANALRWNDTLNAYDASRGAGSGVAQRITNVANGAISAASLDAINGRQLYGTASSIVNLFGTGTVASDGTITGGTFTTGGTTINQALTNLYNIYNSSTAIPSAYALSWSGTLNAYDASRTGVAQRITNVANGLVAASSLDAINGGQLYKAATGIVNMLGTGTVNPDGSVTGGIFIINGGTYSNVSNALTTLDQTLNNILTGGAGLVHQDAVTGNITIGAMTSGTLINIAGISGDRQLTGVAAGTADNDAVNIGQLKAAGIISGSGSGNAIANVVVYDSADKTLIKLGGPTVVGTGSNMTGGTRITNLALAAIEAASTDAVVGSQLFDTNQRVTNLENAVAIIISNTGAPSGSGNGSPHFSTGNDDTTIPATATGGNSIAAGMSATASGTSSSAIGMGAKSTAARSIAIGSLAESHATGGVALGNGALVAATAANSVAIGADSIATDPNTVSFGNDTLQRRLVNIADGINPHDAVNMRQLATFQNAVNDRFANVQNQVNALGDRIDTVGAMSAAINQVHPRLAVSQNGNQNQLALGVGAYRGRGAFAMGYGYTCPQRDRGVQASFALSDNGEIMAGAGAIFGW